MAPNLGFDPYMMGIFSAANMAMPESSGMAESMMAPQMASAMPHPQAFNVQRAVEYTEARRAAFPQMPRSPMPQRQGGRGAGMMRGMFGDQAGQVGLDPSTINPEMMNQMLSPFGVQMPTHTNPFMFFNDQHADGSPTWAANHPKVARVIEGAMLGAQVSQGATVGENISNVASTLMGIPRQYAEHQRAQMMAPIQTASAMEPMMRFYQQFASPEARNRQALQDRHLQAMTDEQEALAQKAKNPPKEYGSPFPGSVGSGDPVWMHQNQATGAAEPMTASVSSPQPNVNLGGGVSLPMSPVQGNLPINVENKPSTKTTDLELENASRVAAGKNPLTPIQFAGQKSGAEAAARVAAGENANVSNKDEWKAQRDDAKTALKEADTNFRDWQKRSKPGQPDFLTTGQEAMAQYPGLDANAARIRQTKDLQAARDKAQAALNAFDTPARGGRVQPRTSDPTPSPSSQPQRRITMPGGITINY